MKNLVFLTAFVGVVLVLAPASGAGVISVNMDSWSAGQGFDEQCDSMPAADIAGLVPAANWNALGGGSLQGVTPVDDSGAPVAGLVITGGSNNSWNTNGSSNKLMFGDFSSPGTVEMSGIPYADYDIIVYSKLWDSSPQDFTIGDTTLTIINDVGGSAENPQSFDNPDWSNGIFADGTHYRTFAGLSGDSQTLTHANMAGFQIVDAAPIPEPATLSLLVFGGLALGGLALARRRR